MGNTNQDKKCTIRCIDCRKEFDGDSVPAILENMRCGQDGGEITNSCKASLKSDGEFLFDVVAISHKNTKGKDTAKTGKTPKEEPPVTSED